MEKINKVLFTADQSNDFTKSQQALARQNIGIPNESPSSSNDRLFLASLYGGSLYWLQESVTYKNDYNTSMPKATETDNTNEYFLYTIPTRYAEGHGILMLYRMQIYVGSGSSVLSYYYSDLEVYFGQEGDLTPARSLIYKTSLLSPGPNGLGGDKAVYQIAFPGTWNQGNLWTLKFIKNVNGATSITDTQINYSSGFLKIR